MEYTNLVFAVAAGVAATYFAVKYDFAGKLVAFAGFVRDSVVAFFNKAKDAVTKAL